MTPPTSAFLALAAIAQIPLSTGEQRFEQAKEASLGYLSSIDSLDHMVKAHQPKGKPMAQQMISTSAAAELWNVSRSQARDYCKRYEKVIHAKKRGRNWYVPADALPPAKLKHAKQFVQSYLKNLNNPTEQFDWSSCGANSKSAPNFLRLLKEAEIVEPRETSRELDINNIRIIDKGWKLAFGQEKGMNKFAISFYLDIKMEL